MSDGWNESAGAWIDQLEHGSDFGRPFVLDPVMTARLDGRHRRVALDIGCGEGRFCRLMRDRGIAAIGLDPTRELLDAAMRRDRETTAAAGPKRCPSRMARSTSSSATSR